MNTQTPSLPLLRRLFALAAALALLALPAWAEGDESEAEALEVAALVEPPSFDRPIASRQAGALSGRVSGSANPLGAVRVYAYQLADLTLDKVTTDRFGRFVFERLPAGLYKVIAHKPGFIPAVVMVTRATAESDQFLDLKLAEDSAENLPEEADFWTVRSRIPADVLREIQFAESEQIAQQPEEPLFSAEIQALSGVDSYAELGDAILTGGIVGLKGQLGDFGVRLRGNFRQLGVDSPALAPGLGAEANALAVDLSAGSSALQLVGQQNRLDRTGTPIDIERYGVDWRQRVGPGESRIAAHYTSEENFYSDDRLSPIDVPEASTTWSVEGSYETQVTQNNSLTAGVNFRQMEASYALDSRTAIPNERLELFSLGNLELQSALMVQYGLFTTLTDGTLSFSPHAGIVIELNDRWTADAAMRQRFEQRRSPELGGQFFPSYFGEASTCSTAEEHCYRVGLTHSSGGENSFSVGGLHREFSETLRMYFSEDFFDHLESLFFVPGDELPEVHVAITRELGPHLLTRFESSVAEGGGGTYRAKGGEVYQNRVGYLVTSLDTRFQPTSTGLLLAFHRIEQSLQRQGLAGSTASPALDLDRLRILLRQELGELLGLANDWAVSFDVQFSRGSLPYQADANPDEIRKRFVGGVAVRF